MQTPISFSSLHNITNSENHPLYSPELTEFITDTLNEVGGFRQSYSFPNGYGAWVTRVGSNSHEPYHVTVMRGDSACFKTPVAKKVLQLKAEEVVSVLEKVRDLPAE